MSGSFLRAAAIALLLAPRGGGVRSYINKWTMTTIKHIDGPPAVQSSSV